MDRKLEIPQTGPMCDLLWSDPAEQQGFAPSSRGAGFFFGEDITQKFLQMNDIEQIVRAHQLVQEGF